jgi:hypothetical protein
MSENLFAKFSVQKNRQQNSLAQTIARKFLIENL